MAANFNQVTRSQHSKWTDGSSFYETQNQTQSEPTSTLEHLGHQARGLHAAGTSTPSFLIREGSGNVIDSAHYKLNYPQEENCVLDTGATDHMTYTKKKPYKF